MRLYIDSDQQDYLQTLKSLSQKFGEPFAYKGMPIEMSRRIVRDMQRDIASGGPKISNVEQLSAIDTGCPVDFRIYSPDGVSQSKTPVLIYAHGGGFCINSVDTHDCLHREYADRLGWLVVAPEYRKAPEHPFPTAIDDISSVANWLIGNAELLKIDVDNFFIGGDSAGGNLALTVPLSMAQKGSHPFRGCIVNYGVLDGNFGTDSYERYGDGPYLLSTADMARFFDWYLDDDKSLGVSAPCGSIQLAANSHLHGRNRRSRVRKHRASQTAANTRRGFRIACVLGSDARVCSYPPSHSQGR